MKEIMKKAIEIATKAAREGRDETPRGSDIVGMGIKEEFELDGQKYLIEGEAFWEKSDWLQIAVSGKEFKEKSEIIYF